MRGTQCLKKLCERTAQETSASEQRQVSSGERSENDCDVKEEKKQQMNRSVAKETKIKD